MKVIIIFDEETGEIFYYVPDKECPDAILIEPRRENPDEEEPTH